MGGYFVYVPRTKPGLVSLPPSHTVSPFIAQAALVVRRLGIWSALEGRRAGEHGYFLGTTQANDTFSTIYCNL